MHAQSCASIVSARRLPQGSKIADMAFAGSIWLTLTWQRGQLVADGRAEGHPPLGNSAGF
jgi:hypothetical protein